MSYFKIEAPPATVTKKLTDPTKPTAQAVRAAQALGLKHQQIAEAFNISLRETRRLLSESQRARAFEFAADYMAANFIPKILANLDHALDNDAKAQLSVILAEKLGVIGQQQAPAQADTSTQSFEEFRLQIIKRRAASEANPHPVIDVTPTAGSLAPAIEGELLEGSEIETDDAGGGEEGSGGSDPETGSGAE